MQTQLDGGARVAALHALKVLDTPREERYERVVRIAREVFGVRAAVVNLVDAHRQFIKAEVGLGGRENAPLSDSLCAHAVAQDAPLIVADAVVEERFAGSALITGPDPVRLYAGHPLHAPTGEAVGTLCLLGDQPRELSERERWLLGEMAGWVERELAAQDELDRAQQIQQGLMPRTAPAVVGWELAGRCTAVSSIGGDFYDWYHIGDSLQLTLADVMGKGIPAALLAASVRAVLRGTFQHNTPCTAIARAAGTLDPMLEDAGAFVTVFTALLDTTTGVLEYVDAGHGLAAVLSPDGGCRRLEASGPPLGAAPGVSYRVRTTVVAPGETLLVVSDGFLDYFTDMEAAVAAGCAANAKASTAAQLVDICADYAAAAGAQDDSTVLVLRRAG